MLDLLNVVPMGFVQVLTTYQDFCTETKAIWDFLGNIVKVLQIAIPVIIILLGTLDLGKAVMAGDDKKVKEAQKQLLMRIIYGVAIFFIVLIIQFVFGLVSGSGADVKNMCFKCVSLGGC